MLHSASRKNAVCLGTDIAEDVHQGESCQAHHFLPAYDYQPIQKRAECCHANGSGEVGKLDMLGNDAEFAHHFGACHRVGTAYSQYRQKEYE